MEKHDFSQHIRSAQIDPTCSHPLYADFVRHIEETMPETSHYIRYFRTLAFALNNDVPLDRVVCDTRGSTFIQFLGNHAEKATYTKCDLRCRLAW